MEAIVIILVVLFALGMQDAFEQLLMSIAVAVILLVGVVALAAGFHYFPVATWVVVACIVTVAVVMLCRWVYNTWLSSQARLNAAYQRMENQWYRLSWHIVQLERNGYGGSAKSNRRWAERVLARTKAEYQLYCKLPPETSDRKPYPYGEWLSDLESRMNAALEKMETAEKN